MTTERKEFGAEIGSVTAGRLIFTRGMSELNLYATDSPEELYRARFEGNVPEVRVDGGVIAVEYPNVLNPLKWSRISADIGLNPTIPWEIEVRGGAAGVTADLTRLRTEGFSLTGGVSNVTVDLPAASGRVPVEISGGANDLTVSRPKDVAASLRVKGGASKLAFDEQRLGAVGGETTLESGNYADATNRYEIVITGGANDVSVAAS